MLWYHASTQLLAVGTVLVPGGGRSRWDANLYAHHPQDAAQRRQWVWVDVDPMTWAGADAPYVYEVRTCDTPRLWYPDDPEEGWITSSAVVIAVLSVDGGATWIDD